MIQKHLFEESKWSFKSFSLVTDENKTRFLNAHIPAHPILL